MFIGCNQGFSPNLVMYLFGHFFPKKRKISQISRRKIPFYLLKIEKNVGHHHF
jgi:hypothetical protein